MARQVSGIMPPGFRRLPIDAAASIVGRLCRSENMSNRVIAAIALAGVFAATSCKLNETGPTADNAMT